MDNESARKWIALLSRSEAKELLGLLVDEHSLVSSADYRQDVWIAAYLDSNCSIHKACRKAHVSYPVYKEWVKQPDFQAKLIFAEQDVTHRLYNKALEKALAGDTDLLKFLLTAFDPAKFDAKYRAQVKANEGQINAILEGNKSFTQDEIRTLLLSDPAQEYVPKSEDIKH